MTPEQLREWRERHGWSLRQMADRLGVNYSAVSRWEQGKRRVPNLLDRALHDLERELCGQP